MSNKIVDPHGKLNAKRKEILERYAAAFEKNNDGDFVLEITKAARVKIVRTFQASSYSFNDIEKMAANLESRIK